MINLIGLRGRSGMSCLAAIVALCIGGLAAGPAAATTHKKKASNVGKVTKAECARNKAAGTITYVGYNYGAAPNTMDPVVANTLGYFKKLCLTVNYVLGSGQKLVSAGTAQVTSGAQASNILGDVAIGDNFVATTTMERVDTTDIITRNSITNLKQLEGKTIGYDQNISVGTLAELQAAGVDYNKINFIVLNDANPYPIENEVFGDSTIYQNTLQLKSVGIPYHDFPSAKYGIQGLGFIQIWNKTFAKANPGVVADFSRADIHAMDYCLSSTAHGNQCVQIMTKGAAANGEGSEYPLSGERALWAFSKQQLKTIGTRPLGVTTLKQWNQQAAEAKKWAPVEASIEHIPVTSNFPAPSTVLDSSWVKQVYNKKGQLIWP